MENSISFENKINQIICMMKEVTSPEKSNSIFNLFIGYLSTDNKLVLKVIDIVKGELVGNQDIFSNSIFDAGALSLLDSKAFQNYNYQNSDSVAFTTNLVSATKSLHNTIGGNIKTMSIDSSGNIKTYVNGIETEF